MEWPDSLCQIAQLWPRSQQTGHSRTGLGQVWVSQEELWNGMGLEQAGNRYGIKDLEPFIQPMFGTGLELVFNSS